MKKLKTVIVSLLAILALLILNQCTDPHWFNGGNGWPDTFLGRLFK